MEGRGHLTPPEGPEFLTAGLRCALCEANTEPRGIPLWSAGGGGGAGLHKKCGKVRKTWQNEALLSCHGVCAQISCFLKGHVGPRDKSPCWVCAPAELLNLAAAGVWGVGGGPMQTWLYLVEVEALGGWGHARAIEFGRGWATGRPMRPSLDPAEWHASIGPLTEVVIPPGAAGAIPRTSPCRRRAGGVNGNQRTVRCGGGGGGGAPY